MIEQIMLSWPIIFGLLALILAWILVKQPKLVFKFNAWMRDYVFSDQVVLFSGKRMAILLLILGVIAIFSGVEHITSEQGLRPKISAKIFTQAQKSYLAGDYEKTIKMCSEILKFDSKNLPVMELLASTYLAMGQKVKTREILLEILKINPTYSFSHGPLKKAYGMLKTAKR